MGAAVGRLIVAVLFLAGPAASAVLAQGVVQRAPGSIEGRVTTEAGEGLADVAVTVPSRPGIGTFTDAEGRFVLGGILPGRVEVRFSRIGYALREMTAFVESESVSSVEAVLVERAIPLEPLAVTVADESIYLGVNGFYRRSERGFGRQYSRRDLDALHMLKVADAFYSIPGLHVQADPYEVNRMVAVRSRVRDGASACPLLVYIDGVRTLDANLNQVPPDWLLGMEVYVGAEAPAQYRLPGSCGAVLLWTRDGRR